eukprot:TRINITY_DN6366_c0_g1_i1.p1 TRINITY_DN6366_c0_g1~~TRINITY_DN6366_c0_g1_i1.p1  ORF type:complete len:469 (-),score=114.01 TRINITY_DN6366_c0_g1_i1:20-1402(-)
MSEQPALSGDEEGKTIPIKQLTHMMLNGQNDVVLQYLKSLPKEECDKTRTRLIKNLEDIQTKRKNNTVSRRTKPSTREDVQKVHSGVDSVGKSSRRKNPRKRITENGDEIQKEESEPKEMIGPYLVDEVLGRGMFGVVYKAEHAETHLVVAIKQIDLTSIEKSKLPGVKREAQVMESLCHPNIVKMYEVLESEDKKSIQFVIEFVDCGSLYRLLKNYGNFPHDLASVCLRQTIEGLAYLHSKNIVHRDIKCDNLLINSDGIIKLADFGAAKSEDHNKNYTVVGTPFWMAPEVIDMSGGGTFSDIWSLGCTTLELLTGEPPYFRLSTMQALFNIVEDECPPLPDNITSDISAYFQGCFQKDTKARATAQDLLGYEWIAKYKSNPIANYTQISSQVKKHNRPEIIEKRARKTKSSLTIPTNATLEELEALLAEVTLSRDTLKNENMELKRQIQELESAVESS